MSKGKGADIYNLVLLCPFSILVIFIVFTFECNHPFPLPCSSHLGASVQHRSRIVSCSFPFVSTFFVYFYVHCNCNFPSLDHSPFSSHTHAQSFLYPSTLVLVQPQNHGEIIYFKFWLSLSNFTMLSIFASLIFRWTWRPRLIYFLFLFTSAVQACTEQYGR